MHRFAIRNRIRLLGFCLVLILLFVSCHAAQEPGDTRPPAEDGAGEGEEKGETNNSGGVSLEQQILNYNYMLGTQAFNPNYQFTDQSPLMEIGGRIVEWGSNMIKFYATDDHMIDELLDEYDFKYVFMWYRSDSHFKDGYSEQEAQADYDAFYAYTKKLLTTYNGSGIEFYLGHWAEFQ